MKYLTKTELDAVVKAAHIENPTVEADALIRGDRPRGLALEVGKYRDLVRVGAALVQVLGKSRGDELASRANVVISDFGAVMFWPGLGYVEGS